MNFLRHSFSSISEPPTVPFPAQQTIDAAADREAGKPPIVLTSTLDSDGEDAARPVDVLRTRNKVPIEDHVDVPDDVGGICIPRGSRLHFKQPVKWHPCSPRDLLLSVSVDPTSVLGSSGACLSSLMPKIITMQATNLTSENMHLTLLAPSSKNSSTSMQFPFAPNSRASSISSFTSFHEKKDRPNVRTGEKDHGAPKEKPNSASLQRSMSLPPVRPIESIMGITPRVMKERAISAADIAAENNSTRTHLWLQSIVPLGSVPPQSTTTVRCELLPLTDGIITLDTLQIVTKERDLIYIPEQPLQIHATSSIGIGLS